MTSGEAQAAHDAAVAARQPTYKDPTTGYQVFTAVALAERGYCCGNGCRHCPYGDGDRPSGNWPTATGH